MSMSGNRELIRTGPAASFRAERWPKGGCRRRMSGTKCPLSSEVVQPADCRTFSQKFLGRGGDNVSSRAPRETATNSQKINDLIGTSGLVLGLHFERQRKISSWECSHANQE